MSDKFFFKLDIPILTLEDLGKIVSENSLRLLKLAKEVNDYIGQNNVIVPNYQGFFVKLVPSVQNNQPSGLKGSKNGLISKVVKISEVTVKMSPQNVQCLTTVKFNSNISSDKNVNIMSEVPEQQEKVSCTKSCEKVFVNQEKLDKSLVNLNREDSPEISVILEHPPPLIVTSRQSVEKPKETNKVGGEVSLRVVEENVETNKNVEERSLCVISEVFGNANEAFSGTESVEEAQIPFIKPQKTNDITKIKGWRRKQFFVEKPTTVEFYSTDKQPSSSGEKTSDEVEICESVIESCESAEEKTPDNSNYNQPSSSIEVEVDTNKVKGWRRKQFLVAKPTTIEFYSYNKNASSRKIVEGSVVRMKDWRRKQCLVEKPTTVEYYYDKQKQTSAKVEPEIEEEIPGSKENAFICDSLDDFLDNESELKINYEIPHLYAEVGIKLTSDDIVSRPNLSEEDFKRVETKYCIPVVKTELLDSELEEIEKGLRLQEENEEQVVKTIKSEDGRRRKIRTKRQLAAVSNVKKPQKVVVTQGTIDLLNSLNLVRKFIGLAVYPKPGNPLHPLVRQHLNKLRSYHTKIDKNWANFAASVVRSHTNTSQRFILPVYICGKVKDDVVEPEVEIISDNIQTDRTERGVVSPPPTKETAKTKEDQGQPSKKIKLTECRVVLEKIKLPPNPAFWCMDHNCYNCDKCGLSELFNKSEIIFKQNKSVQGTFEKNVAALLAKKLKHLKPNKDVLIGVDSLKTLTPNSLELIKLNFIKQSFLSGDINIWYLKAESTNVKSRAFLTFSPVPPEPNAIDIKLDSIPCTNLPQVITDIMSANNQFDTNEYAILHCNGELWEIHGSLSLAIGKNEITSEKNMEQIYSSVPLPELTFLQSLSEAILNVKSSKWWVLDLTQKFHELKIKSGPHTAVMIPKRFFNLDFKKSKFMSLRKYNSGRVLGAYIFNDLLPFVLIGPYHLFENHELFLKKNSSPLPFMYFGEESSSQNCPLKFFINSVILEYENSEKKLCGLWLYDKIKLDSTCYLEVTAVNSDYLLPKKYSIEIEHGYSLNSGASSSQSSTNSTTALSGKETKESPKKATVYIYFEIFELGYIVGELQPDNTIIITHPLDQKNKVKSDNIGNWFIQLIRKKIHFIPSDLTLAWFITRHKDDLRERLPFNKFYLGGAHILCKKGLFFMLELTEEKISELGLDVEKVSKAVNASKVITEVKELKNLAVVLSQNSSTYDSMSMEQILLKAGEEIGQLRKISEAVERAKKKVLSDQLKLVSLLLLSLKSADMNIIQKVECLLKVKTALMDKHGNVFPDFVKLLDEYDFGKKFIILTKSDDNQEKKKKDSKKSGAKSKKKSKSGNLQGLRSDGSYPTSLIKKLETRLQRIYTTLEHSTADPGSQEHKKLLKKIEKISNQLDAIKNMFNRVTDRHGSDSNCSTCHANPNILKSKWKKDSKKKNDNLKVN